MPNYDILLQEAPAREFLLGNYAFVRGMLEAGVQVATCYPGSPTAEMADAMMAINQQAGLYFEISTNEKVALEVAATSAIVGRPAVCWMKSVGLNVASDSAIQLALFTMPGGLVVILGDDPGHLSSQNEQDNRYFARAGLVPFLEPATPQECKDYFLYAMQLAQKLQMPVFIRATTRNCHQIGPVEFGPRRQWDRAPAWDNEIMRREGGYVPLPGTLPVLKPKALKRLAQAGKEIEAAGLNRVETLGQGEPQIRLIASGHTYQALVSALDFMGVSAEILKLAQTHPLPADTVAEFVAQGPRVHVLEELDPVLEREIKALCFDRGIVARVIGKLGLPEERELLCGEYDPTRMVQIVASRLDREAGLDFQEPALTVPGRSPTLCPGCGHRTAFFAAKKALGEGKEAFAMADIGCYSLGYLPPFELGNLLYCMGSGAPAASAMALAFPDEPVMSFVGDSTFFHAALPGIINAVFNGHRQVIMVMDNGITAMTGHQPNPGSGRNARGEIPGIVIDEVLKALGIGFVERHPAYDTAALGDALQRAFAHAKSPDGGVAVVIQEEPSALTSSRQKLRQGTLPNPFRVDLEVCRNIRNCLEHFSCPAIGRNQQDKTAISTDLCVGCGSCVQTCPMKEKPIKQIAEFKRV